MKLRNDFVTNSSSSSYIFRSNDLASFRKQVEEEINRLLTEEYMEACHDNNFFHYQYDQEWYQKRFDSEFRWMADLTPLREFDNNNITEVYSWYFEEIHLIAFLGLDAFMESPFRTGELRICDKFKLEYEEEKNYNRNREKMKADFWKEHFADIKNRSLTNECIHRLVGILILDHFDEKTNPFESDNRDVFSENMMNDIMTDLAIKYSQRIKSDLTGIGEFMAEFFFAYYESILEIMPEFYGLTAGGALEKIMGACYMNFEEYEWSDLLLENAVTALPGCVLWCRHMG